jgi:hypothetical protein
MALPKSFFSTKKAVQKEIEVDGEKHTVWLRKPTAFEQQKFYAGHTSNDISERIDAGFYLLSVCFVDENGLQLMDVETAKMLEPDAHAAIIVAINDVMGEGQKKA